MCDIVTRPETVIPFCQLDNRFICSRFEACQSQEARKAGVRIGAITRLCNMHAEFCQHCGKPFCSPCLEGHQDACEMKPRGESTWDVVSRVLTENPAM